MAAFPFDLALDARTAVRIVCGAFFLPHTVAKLRNIDRASILFDKVGFRPPRPFVLLTTAMELVAAFGLISGLYPRVASVVAAIVLLGAAYAIGRNHGLMWRWQHPGVEYMLFWAIVCLFVGFLP
ncbi:MAG TPA: DoxX family protein [Xanthobacteraceae bacterium]|jgi:putative oxidoreductase